MEFIGSLFLVLALGLVVALFVARPFINRTAIETSSVRGQAEQREHSRSTLLADRDRILTALQELDFDYAMGKIPAEDYPPQREALVRSGVEVLRKLDAIEVAEMGNGQRPAEKPLVTSAAAADAIEAAVAARRADAALVGSPVQAGGNGSAAGAPVVKDELEELIASRKRTRKESTSGFCPRCGRPVQKSDKFCAKCGSTL